MYVCIYTFISICHTFAQAHRSLKHMHMFASCVYTRACACLHICAHTRVRAPAAACIATAHSGGAPHGPPAERVPPRGRAAQAGKAAHTAYMVDTRAVFHAPMFALNATAPSNACEPSHPRSTPTEGARTVRRRCGGAQTRTHPRAQTDAAPKGVCVAGPHRRSVHLGS
jgi:hypothetical protein